MEPPPQFLSENIKRLYELDFISINFVILKWNQLHFFFFNPKILNVRQFNFYKWNTNLTFLSLSSPRIRYHNNNH